MGDLIMGILTGQCLNSSLTQASGLFIECLDDCFFTQRITQLTRNCTALDFVITNIQTSFNIPNYYGIRPCRCQSAAAYSDQTLQRTVCRCVHASVCLLDCGKTANQIRMPFGVIGWTGPGMRQVVGVVDLEHSVYSLTYMCYVTTVKSCFTVQ